MTRRPYTPTEADRTTVKELAGYGIPQEDIARHIGINFKTLTKYYKLELDTAVVDINHKVATHLFKLATTSENPTAAIFWCKTRMKWQEVQRLEFEDKTKTTIDRPPRESREDWLIRRNAEIEKLKTAMLKAN